MEPQIIFKEVMKSDKLQSHFNINKIEAEAASYTSQSEHIPVEIIKDVINSVANRRTVQKKFRSILNRVSD